jgi:uncharacterized protein YqjF (DUF2071 family)|tara:strand:- start:452 stop:1180 length:729 start_codon:yes stop_codon:yes gene_type:complete
MRSDHLPFAMPERSHSLIQEWRNLSFLHWEVDPDLLSKHIPKGLEIDTYNGKAYVGTIPFIMKNVRPRFTFPVPGISTFPEFNVRTYVTKNGKGGVLFLTLEAQSRITCAYAPKAYGLPYNYAKGKMKVQGNSHRWETKRTDGTHGFSGFCSPTGPEQTAQSGSLEEFLFERYSLYMEHKENLCIAHTQHDPWVFQDAEATILENNLTESFNLGIENPLEPDLIHISKGVFVHAWSNEVISR